MSTGRRRVRPGGGFSLIEVVAALTILTLMAGTIFSVVTGSAQAAGEIEQMHAEDGRAEVFLGHCRRMFETMPGGATLELRQLEESPPVQELVVRGAPGAFYFGEDPVAEVAELRLGVRRYGGEDGPAAEEFSGSVWKKIDAVEGSGGDDRFYLGLSTANFFRPVAVESEGRKLPRSPVKRREGNQYVVPDREGRFWMELLPDVKEVRWRFYDLGKKQWLEKAKVGRPPLVEVSVWLRGRTFPLRAQFRPGGKP